MKPFEHSFQHNGRDVRITFELNNTSGGNAHIRAKPITASWTDDASRVEMSASGLSWNGLQMFCQFVQELMKIPVLSYFHDDTRIG